MMNIFKILQKRSRFFYLFLLVLGLTNALWNNALLLLINNKLNNTPLPFFGNHAFAVFIFLIITSYLVGRVFQKYILKLTIDLAYEMGILIFAKARHATYEEFIQYGKEKIYSLLGDTQVVSQFPGSFIDIFNSFIVFTVALIYLFTISFFGAAAVLIVLVVLGIIYYYQTLVAEKSYNAQRELSDSYNKTIVDFLLGFKEMKMSTDKGANLYASLNKNRVLAKDLNIQTSVKWLNNDLLGRYFWFIIIGLVLYVLPGYFSMDGKIVGTFIITLLFLIGPVGTLIASIPLYSRIKIAVERLEQFDMQVAHSDLSSENAPVPAFLTGYFRKVELVDLEYQYAVQHGETEGFSVTIPNLSIQKGEVVFVTGGNGSGKTTMINILAGLYRPAKGKIVFNGIDVDLANYPYYRNRIAVVFSDNYLFSENYENYRIHSGNAELNDYINFMKLAGIITINDSQNRMELDLSRGQQKRLSMIYALMENKDILILDEWAADQDPHFRAYFYTVFLETLKLLGKTIIMVTHDDSYYQFADRVIKFDFGRIVSDQQILAKPVYNSVTK